jgi:electron transport complex protein RnfD
MRFPTISSPHTHRPNTLDWVMLQVILAMLPGVAALTWYFGWGVLINMLLASISAVAAEALVLKLRNQPVLPALSDLSAVVTALLLAAAVPPTLPWWLTVLGVVFAIVVVKQLYGGIGYNPFNPAMAGYVFLLISYPLQMTTWLPPEMLNPHPLSLLESLQLIFTGGLPPGLSVDAITMATPLDEMRTNLDLNKMISEIRQSPLWGDFGGLGWEWVGNWFFIGGIWLIYRRVISWHIPLSMLGTLILVAGIPLPGISCV